MAVATPADTQAERSRLANGLCDLPCSVVPVEVRATLLGGPRSMGGLPAWGVHLVVDGCGLPISMLLTPGQAGHNPQLLPLFAHTRNRPALTRVVASLRRERRSSVRSGP